MLKSHNFTDNPILNRFSSEDYPEISIHIPVFNESTVIQKTIESILEIKYPANLIHVLIADDSTDSTIEIIDDLKRRYEKKFKSFVINRRNNREGFKAGALQQLISLTPTDLILILDADGRIDPDYFNKTVHYFKDNDSLGAVQARWRHTNQNNSLFTRSMSIGIDGHYFVEKPGRMVTNGYITFNGTGGLWKKDVIEKAGGWYHRTLAEDLDLAYRVQLLGYSIKYISNVYVSQEVPSTLRLWSIQQTRWSQGFSQNFRLHSHKVIQNKLKSRFQGIMHLSSYSVPVFLLLNSILGIILLFFEDFDPILMSILSLPLSLITFLGIIVYSASIFRSSDRKFYDIIFIPFFLFWGASLIVRIGFGTVKGLVRYYGTFVRTPKFNFHDKSNSNINNHPFIPLDATFLFEVGYLAILFLGIMKTFSFGITMFFSFLLYCVLATSMLFLIGSNIRHFLKI